MKNVKDLSLEELICERDILNKEINELRTEIQSVTDKFHIKNDRLKIIDNSIDEKTLDPEDIAALLESFPETKQKSKLREKYLSQYYLSANSYFIDTSQQCVRIALYKNNDEITQKTYEGIMKILPFIKELKTGNKTFDIFENTLNKYESYYLCFDGKTWSVQTSRYSRYNTTISNEDLMTVLKYIQQNLYIEETYGQY